MTTKKRRENSLLFYCPLCCCKKIRALCNSSHPLFHEKFRLFRPIRIPLLVPGDAGGSGVLGFEEVVEAGEVVEVVVQAAVGEKKSYDFGGGGAPHAGVDYTFGVLEMGHPEEGFHVYSGVVCEFSSLGLLSGLASQEAGEGFQCAGLFEFGVCLSCVLAASGDMEEEAIRSDAFPLGYAEGGVVAFGGSGYVSPGAFYAGLYDAFDYACCQLVFLHRSSFSLFTIFLSASSSLIWRMEAARVEISFRVLESSRESRYICFL